MLEKWSKSGGTKWKKNKGRMKDTEKQVRKKG